MSIAAHARASHQPPAWVDESHRFGGLPASVIMTEVHLALDGWAVADEVHRAVSTALGRLVPLFPGASVMVPPRVAARYGEVAQAQVDTIAAALRERAATVEVAPVGTPPPTTEVPW